MADYILGASCVSLYLSVRYHTLQPDYIHERIKSLGKGHRLRVLLVQVDVKVCSQCYCYGSAAANYIVHCRIPSMHCLS